ncbi:hypothetical protein [Candidatus Harpocratesius sp.]
MIILYEPRASTILYNTLKSNNFDGKFLIPANICPIVPLTLLKAGQSFEFVDISLQDYLIDQEAVLSRVEKNPSDYSGIIVVRTYGYLSDLNYFFWKLKRLKADLFIVDDSCLAIPDFSISSHNHADLILYSTGYAKYADIGTGGFGYLKENYEYSRQILEFSESALQEITNQYKSRIERNEIFEYSESLWLETASPSISFEEYKEKVKNHCESVKLHKKKINLIYTSRIPSEYQLKKDYQNWRFNILVPDKEKLIHLIFQAGLFASSHYASISHIFGKRHSPNSKKLHSQIVNLFNDFYFTEKQAEKISEIVVNYLHSKNR